MTLPRGIFANDGIDVMNTRNPTTARRGRTPVGPSSAARSPPSRTAGHGSAAVRALPARRGQGQPLPPGSSPPASTTGTTRRRRRRSGAAWSRACSSASCPTAAPRWSTTSPTGATASAPGAAVRHAGRVAAQPATRLRPAVRRRRLGDELRRAAGRRSLQADPRVRPGHAGQGPERPSALRLRRRPPRSRLPPSPTGQPDEPRPSPTSWSPR